MRGTYSQVIVDYLLTGEEPTGEAWWEFMGFGSCDDRTIDGAWEDLRNDLLANWIREHAGSRPWAWWEFDAPRWDRKFDGFWDGTLPEPRLRIGGIGTPAYETLAYVPAFTRGVPDSWVKEWDVSYYNGRSVDIHGNRIGTEYTEGRFPYQAIDPGDPPVFESEASYLDRHGFLSAAERKALPSDAFDPEKVQC